ncbi:glycosyltransferase [Parvularcula sp. ZS-1/3]|uniref:Glycosyltransferase n=1 Tax=Parvularcula mediterranea TaxID=2732508 RepID=A0A7Y3RMK9_9PROT|nr:glycosyltransferase [Parvularcula mediterranea]NNU16848.1 glycosyltransferase [Parvularcula mediterranea]
MTDDPSVSVLMSVRDGSFLAPALDTLLVQTVRDFDVVLVDDGADRETKALIASYAEQEPRIRVFENERNLGLAASLNRGLAEVRAPLVARADADDLYHPERLERQLAEFETRPNLGVLSCGYERIDGEDRHLFSVKPAQGHDLIRFRSMFINCVLHPGVMFRTEIVRDAGGYDERFWTAQDSELWSRLLAVTTFDNLTEPLVKWRRHGASTLGSRGDEGKALSNEVSVRLHERYLGEPTDADEVRAAVQLWRSFDRLDLRTVELGLRGLRRVHSVAQKKEPPSILRDFERRIATSLSRQTKRNVSQRPADAGAMAPAAVRWFFGRPGLPASEAPS